jgi:hypothetical protein
VELWQAMKDRQGATLAVLRLFGVIVPTITSLVRKSTCGRSVILMRELVGAPRLPFDYVGERAGVVYFRCVDRLALFVLNYGNKSGHMPRFIDRLRCLTAARASGDGFP